MERRLWQLHELWLLVGEIKGRALPRKYFFLADVSYSALYQSLYVTGRRFLGDASLAPVHTAAGRRRTARCAVGVPRRGAHSREWMPMQRISELLDGVRRLLQRAWTRTSSGQRMLAIVSALSLLMITGTLALMSMQPGKAPQTARVPTDTPFVTATATLAPSATATLKPPATPSHPVVQGPKPPPIPGPPKPTPTPRPTATPAASATPGPTSTPAPTATPCGPGAYQGGNPTQALLRSAMQTAATTYGIPVNLVYSVAWEESRWHQDVVACDGGIGLMQIQPTTAPWLNSVSVSVCSLTATTYDVNTYQGNALLGAKFLKWLSCFYSYWGNNGGTSVSNPGNGTIAWYYKSLGLQYPDTKNADGSTNPNSYCYAVYKSSPENPNLPSTTADPWSCPYNPACSSSSQGCDPNRIHQPDNTLLDATISAYNQGPGNFDNYGLLNHTYVSNIEGYIPQFQSGALPTAS